MSVYETLNYWASMYASIACIVFVVAYSILAPWWKSATGRMIMLLVGGLAGLAILSLAFYTFKDTDTVRLLRAVLVIGVGTALWWQAAAVVKVQWQDRKERRRGK